jgi:hypothetical protein
MGPKRKNNENGSSRIVVLEEPVGAVKWVRVTSTTDTSNDRVCFCINLHSGAPSDVPILSASILDRKRLFLKITHHEVTKDQDMQFFSEKRIIETVSAGRTCVF